MEFDDPGSSENAQSIPLLSFCCVRVTLITNIIQSVTEVDLIASRVRAPGSWFAGSILTFS